MPDSNTARGACLCGEIRFSVELPTLFCGHCHCTMCQRNHGAAYVTWVAVPRLQFRLDAGEASLVVHNSSDHGRRSFCGKCGSSLFCEIDEHPDQVDIPLASFEDPIDKEPQAHIFYDDRASWVAIGDQLPRLGGASGMEPVEED